MASLNPKNRSVARGENSRQVSEGAPCSRWVTGTRGGQSRFSDWPQPCPRGQISEVDENSPNGLKIHERILFLFSQYSEPPGA